MSLLVLVSQMTLAQVPTISSFTPTSGPVGTTVAITGTGFNAISSLNIVFFGAVRAVVNSGSATLLSVDVPAGANHKAITVLNQSNGLSGSSVMPFIVTFALAGPMSASSFGTAVDFTTGGTPYKAAIADFDGDLKVDVAVTNTFTNNFSVFRNISTAGSISASSFESKVDFNATGNQFPIAAGDLDGDGRIDVVVANAGGVGTLSVLRNTSSTGNLSFDSKVDFSTGSNPLGLLIGDVDGDGKQDLIVGNYNDNTISILQNTSTQGVINVSSFAARVDFVSSSGPQALAFSDLDLDGKKDIVVANSNSNSISVFRNTSVAGTINSASLATRIDFGTSSIVESVCAGDFDGDGKEDIVATNFGTNTVSVFRNTHITGPASSGTLAAKVDFSTGTFQSEVKVADINGDGRLDIIVDDASTNIAVLRNTATAGVINSGSFASKIDYPIAVNASGVEVGDVDGDGKPEIITVHNGGFISVLHNKVLAPEPDSQPSGINFFHITSTAFDASWTEPNPAPDGYLAVISAVAAPTFVPVDGIPYNLSQVVGVVSGQNMTVYQNASEPGIDVNGLTLGEVINVKVYAFNGSGPTINYLTTAPLTGAQTPTQDLDKPVAANATPTTVAPNASLVFRADFTDAGSGVDYAEVEYRPITAVASVNFQTLEMFPTTGATFEIGLPADQVGELGVEYRFNVVDFEGNDNSIAQTTHTTRVRQDNGLFIPYPNEGRTVANYRIIAVPLILDDKSLNTVIGSTLGPYDNTVWAAYRWNGTRLDELNNDTQVEIGKGYWFITETNVGNGMNTGPGVTPDVSPSNPFQITLTPGWNQIGNPYNFHISWNDVLLANPTKVASLGGASSKIRVWRGSADNVDELVTFEGGFVKNTSTSNVIIDIPVAKNPSINSRMATAGPLRNAIDQPDWEIMFNLSQGELAYNLGGLGMRPDADVEYDTFDDFNLPRFFEYLEVKFPKERVGMTYTKDIVPTAANFVWPFTVDSNIGQGPITIGWDNSYFGSGKEIFLVDLSEHRAINMGEVEKYTFSPSPSRPFEVVYGDAEFVKNEILPDQPVLFAPYPNPFSEKVSLGYSLPKDAAIHGAQLDIYNNQGARVSAVELSAEPGEGSWEWVSEQAPGLYFVRLRAGDHLVMRKLIKR